MLNEAFPTPDPSWEYAGIWNDVWSIRAQTEQIIKYIREVEDANNESDRILRDHLEQIQIRLNSAVAMLNDRGLPY